MKRLFILAFALLSVAFSAAQAQPGSVTHIGGGHGGGGHIGDGFDDEFPDISHSQCQIYPGAVLNHEAWTRTGHFWGTISINRVSMCGRGDICFSGMWDHTHASRPEPMTGRISGDNFYMNRNRIQIWRGVCGTDQIVGTFRNIHDSGHGDFRIDMY